MNMLNETLPNEGTTYVKTVSRSVNMLLCNSCYWCATQLEEREGNTCPSCSNVIEAIPIGKGEIFSLEVDLKKDVSFQFKK